MFKNFNYQLSNKMYELFEILSAQGNLYWKFYFNLVPQGPAFVATVAPGFNQQFGQPTQGTHLAAGTHSGIPGHSPSVGFGPSSQPGFQSTAAPSSKGLYNENCLSSMIY